MRSPQTTFVCVLWYCKYQITSLSTNNTLVRSDTRLIKVEAVPLSLVTTQCSGYREISLKISPCTFPSKLSGLANLQVTLIRANPWGIRVFSLLADNVFAFIIYCLVKQDLNLQPTVFYNNRSNLIELFTKYHFAFPQRRALSVAS